MTSQIGQKILVTGSSGLVGAALVPALRNKGIEVIGLDMRADCAARGDVRDVARVFREVARVDGVVHLAAVSRVVWGERDPALCRATNLGGLHNVLDAAARSARAPWVIFASSREVYGQPDSLPVNEDAPLRPMNVYGNVKAEGEHLVTQAQHAGQRACIIRLSNVFGSTSDHADRVVPSFARAAATGADLRVDGLDHTFDFTHIDDVVRGILALIELLGTGDRLPVPIQFVSGKPTTLGELAKLAIRLGGSGSSIRVAEPRNFDVARFYGNPSRAKALLGWQAQVKLGCGLARLVQAFRDDILPAATRQKA